MTQPPPFFALRGAQKKKTIPRMTEMNAATHLKGSKYETTVEWSSRFCKEHFTHKCHLKHQQVIISIRVNKGFIRDPHLAKGQAYNLPTTVALDPSISSPPLPQPNTSVGGRNKVIHGLQTKRNQHLWWRLHSNKASSTPVNTKISALRAHVWSNATTP